MKFQHCMGLLCSQFKSVTGNGHYKCGAHGVQGQIEQASPCVMTSSQTITHDHSHSCTLWGMALNLVTNSYIFLHAFIKINTECPQKYSVLVEGHLSLINSAVNVWIGSAVSTPSYLGSHSHQCACWSAQKTNTSQHHFMDCSVSVHNYSGCILWKVSVYYACLKKIPLAEIGLGGSHSKRFISFLFITLPTVFVNKNWWIF